MNPLANYAKGKERSIKTYTVCQESKYLVVSNLPELDLLKEIQAKMEEFGKIIQCRYFDEFSVEQDKVQDTVLIKYESIESARLAKRKTNNLSFYGNLLDVAYYPKAEAFEETKEKLDGRIDLVKNYQKKDKTKKEEVKVTPLPDLLKQSKALQLSAKRPLAHARLTQPILYKRKKRLDI